MADTSLAGLSWLNFLVSGMLSGFGPFVSVRLTADGWDKAAIGAVLSAATIAAVVTQVPSGALIDRFTSKRGPAALAIAVAMAALLVLAVTPGFVPVMVAEAAQGAAGVGLNLSIAAITLSLARQDRLGLRFGRNVRYGAVGAALGAALFGLVGSFVSDRAVFLVAAAFGVPAVLVLRFIQPATLAAAHTRTTHHTAPPPHRRTGPTMSTRQLLRDRRVLVFFGCVVLFHLGNASLLPLAAAELTTSVGSRADLVTAAAVTVPQLLAALLSPRIGTAAQQHGRRAVLMLGFAAVPLRGLLFALNANPVLTLAAQTLDGVSAATFGVMMPLVVADITHRGGRFNFTLGLMGLAASLGATVSTSAAGAIADAAGLPVAFLALAAAGAASILLIWTMLPETAHLSHPLPATAHRSHSA